MADKISSIRLEGFKSFQDTKEVPIRKLTVVFGRNNVGKSSLLQSLLLLRQTLDAPEASGRLTLRGHLLDVGSYVDLVHMHQAKRNIRFAIKFSALNEDYLIKSEYSSDEPRPPRLVAVSLVKGKRELISIKRGKGQGGPYELHILGKRQEVDREDVDKFSFRATPLFPRVGFPVGKSGRPGIGPRSGSAWIEADIVLTSFENLLRQIRAIGPFRQRPARRYDYSGLAHPEVDINGSNVVDALIHDSLRRGKLQGDLVDAVNKWLAIVGRVRLMPVKSISSAAKLYELRVRDKDSGRWANISDIGSGIAQALPVLVEGLRTSEGGLFIVQEPEIHLHPDAQLGMADFLISLAATGRTVIVETHSENFLLRLRKRLLEKKSRIKKEDVSVLVVEKSKAGSSSIRQVELDSLSQPIGWPKGFMEDVTRERIQLMSTMAAKVSPAKKRKKKRL